MIANALCINTVKTTENTASYLYCLKSEEVKEIHIFSVSGGKDCGSKSVEA